MDCSTPGLPVHQLREFTQTHVHWVGDAIQPSHLLSSPLLLPSIFPSITVFSNELVLRIRGPKNWSFSFNISPSNGYSGLISFRMDWLDLRQSKRFSRVFCSTTDNYYYWPNKAAWQVSGWFSGNQKSRENQLWVGSAYAEWKGEGAR